MICLSNLHSTISPNTINGFFQNGPFSTLKVSTDLQVSLFWLFVSADFILDSEDWSFSDFPVHRPPVFEQIIAVLQMFGIKPNLSQIRKLELLVFFGCVKTSQFFDICWDWRFSRFLAWKFDLSTWHGFQKSSFKRTSQNTSDKNI